MMHIELYMKVGKFISEIELPELPLVGDHVRIHQNDTSAPKNWVVVTRGWKLAPSAPGQATKKVSGMLFVELLN